MAEMKKANQKSEQSTRLYRSESNKIIAGVAGGLADFFGIDATIIRIIFLLLTFGGGAGVIIYIILWIVMPSESHINLTSEDVMKKNVEELKGKAKDFASSFQRNSKEGRDDSRFVWGAFILILGLIFLLNNYGFINALELQKLWPFLLVIFGFSLLTKK